MESLRDLPERELVWTQPKAMKMKYELHDGGKMIAALEFRSLLGSFARGESADGVWTFKRAGFLRTHVTVREESSEEDIAVYRNNTWTHGGVLELPGGRTFPANSNLWMTKYGFFTEDGVPLVEYTRIGGVLHLSASMIIHREAISLPMLPWLGLLGWYLAVMMHRDAAVAAGAAGSS